MTTETFYKKIGGKYIPCKYYDDVVMNAFPMGATLVVVDKNTSSRRYGIRPEFAATLAASIVIEDAITKVIHDASAARPKTTPVTQEQRDAWDKCEEAWGDDRFYVEYPASVDSAHAASNALSKEVEKMMLNETVRDAYQQFLMVYQLSKKHEL
jgi:hypothetical protein